MDFFSSLLGVILIGLGAFLWCGMLAKQIRAVRGKGVRLAAYKFLFLTLMTGGLIGYGSIKLLRLSVEWASALTIGIWVGGGLFVMGCIIPADSSLSKFQKTIYMILVILVFLVLMGILIGEIYGY